MKLALDYNIPPIEEVTRLHSAAVTSAAAVSSASSGQMRGNTGAIRTQASHSGQVRQSTGRTGSASGQPVRRTAAQMSAVRAVQKNAEKAAQARRATSASRNRPVEDEDERSKAATIAVIVCSLVAVVAIVIFLVTLLGGGEKTILVSVPTLIGRNYDTLLMEDELILAPPKYEYDATYEKGQIIHQEPEPGTKVNPGTSVNIIVSLGQMPQVKTMENLVGQERTIAENFLTGQGLLYLCMEESSDTVAAGLVTRTDPAEGEELTDGQTVKLYISTGPAILEIQMPDIVNRKISAAEAVLDMQGITLKIEKKEEDSLEVEAGCVIRTEPAAGKTVKTGDTVTIFGTDGSDSIGVDDMTARLRTVPYEMLCSINKRIPRIYLDGENETEILQDIV